MQPPQMDYREWLAIQPWDCIIADIPWPYGSRGSAKSRCLVPYATLDNYYDLMQACYATLKPDRNCWMWTDWYNLPALLLAASEAGFTYHALCCMKRVDFGLGSLVRKQMYYLAKASRIAMLRRGCRNTWASTRSSAVPNPRRSMLRCWRIRCHRVALGSIRFPPPISRSIRGQMEECCSRHRCGPKRSRSGDQGSVLWPVVRRQYPGSSRRYSVVWEWRRGDAPKRRGDPGGERAGGATHN